MRWAGIASEQSLQTLATPQGCPRAEPGPEFVPPRCATLDGYNVHAGVVVGGHDEEAVDRLCFDVVGAACPVCGRVMALRAVVRGPETGRVLAGLERAARGPPVRDVGAAGA